MAIRKLKEEDLPQLLKLYNNFFLEHNIFQGNESKALSYLKELAEKHKFLVYDENGELQGALCLFEAATSTDNKHYRYRYRHFAFHDENVAQELLKEAESTIKEASNSAKVELFIDENEKGIAFYKGNGYVQEGTLENHFRWGEKCYILSKSFPPTE